MLGVAACAADPPRDGATLYADECAHCHGPSGDGYADEVASALADRNLQASASDAFLHENIARGRPSTKMIAWSTANGGPLDDAEIDAVIGFVRGFQPNLLPAELDESALAGSEAEGDVLYRQRCGDCHGSTGKGDLSPSIANPLFLELASDGYLRFAIGRGRGARVLKSWMPSYLENGFTAEQIDSLVWYVRALGAKN